MFIQYFDFFINCIKETFNTMKCFPLFDNFTYYHLFFFLFAIPIIFKLLSLIWGIEENKHDKVPFKNYTFIRYDQRKYFLKRGDK